MWKCQLCQREFDDTELKHEIPTTDLQSALQGIVQIKTLTEVSFLCEDCYQEYQKILNSIEEG
jgi:DNA-directed RNA polymerase subunit RPC12/RpoP